VSRDSIYAAGTRRCCACRLPSAHTLRHEFELSAKSLGFLCWRVECINNDSTWTSTYKLNATTNEPQNIYRERRATPDHHRDGRFWPRQPDPLRATSSVARFRRSNTILASPFHIRQLRDSDLPLYPLCSPVVAYFVLLPLECTSIGLPHPSMLLALCTPLE